MKRRNSQFRMRLARQRVVWQAGLSLSACVRVVGWATLVLACYMVADCFLALGSQPRVILGAVAGAALGFALLSRLTRILLRRDRQMAERADMLAGGERQTVLSAYELEEWANAAGFGDSEFRRFLIGRAVDRADAELAGLSLREYFPGRQLGRRLRSLLLQLCLLAAIFYVNTDAAYTILLRILTPTRDIPPYSQYVFTLDPARPTVLYGNDVEISVDIGGGVVDEQVWFLTRHAGKVHRTACFHESDRLFAQRLEKVVTPLEFCFGVGRARSRWHSVNLLLEPQIAVARATITAPSYALLPTEQFFVGNREFAALRHSKAELTVTSNRPLLGGDISLEARDGSGNDRIVRGRKVGLKSVRFAWDMTEPANLKVRVRDVRGTWNADPLAIRQAIVADEPPSAVINLPSGFALATPSIMMPLEGSVTDDLGLRRVDLVRSVVGYRDRSRGVGPDVHTRQLDVSQKFRLSTLGVEPGQVLEFYLEAMDSNPSLAGVSASDIVRVEIISEEEYAAMLRAKITLEDFMARYRTVRSQFDRLRRSLEALRAGVGTEGEAGALDEAKEQSRAAAELFAKMADDFAVYDMESQLSEFLEGSSAALRENAEALAKAKPGQPNLAFMASEMLAAMGEQSDEIEEFSGDAEIVRKVALVMECAARFRAVLRRQKALVRRLEGSEIGNSGARNRLVRHVEREETEIHEALLSMRKDLRDRADALPPEFPILRATAEGFAKRIDELRVPSLMGSATLSARNEDIRESRRYATLALEKLQELVSQPDEGFGSMADAGSGGGDKEFSVHEDLQQTLQQMMASMMLGASGQGRGHGMGMGLGGSGRGGGGLSGGGTLGGSAGDGYRMGGHSPLNIPVFGPDRMSFAGSDSGATGRSRDGAGVGDARVRSDASETMTVTDSQAVGSESMAIEEIPEKYREAVKRYFSDDK